ncbi:hypothetical protein GCM10022226_47340 [Sphaerisporangium flaviroseum]|uniref:Transposase n=1 Tax=Sphaerisporangium flaviroseum TaxID=509199 RepID=A0ABP7ILH7_9ACTN
MVATRLARPDSSQRKLAMIATGELVENNGRLLAYAAPWFAGTPAIRSVSCRSCWPNCMPLTSWMRQKPIEPIIPRRGTPHSSGLGIHRWVVEQTIALLHWFRRLRIRWEIRDDIHEAFMILASAIIC